MLNMTSYLKEFCRGHVVELTAADAIERNIFAVPGPDSVLVILQDGGTWLEMGKFMIYIHTYIHTCNSTCLVGIPGIPVTLLAPWASLIFL